MLKQALCENKTKTNGALIPCVLCDPSYVANRQVRVDRWDQKSFGLLRVSFVLNASSRPARRRRILSRAACRRDRAFLAIHSQGRLPSCSSWRWAPDTAADVVGVRCGAEGRRHGGADDGVAWEVSAMACTRQASGRSSTCVCVLFHPIPPLSVRAEFWVVRFHVCAEASWRLGCTNLLIWFEGVSFFQL
jgi:hypothetical protein